MTPTPPGDSEQEGLVTDLSAKAGAFTPGVLPLTVLPEGGKVVCGDYEAKYGLL